MRLVENFSSVYSNLSQPSWSHGKLILCESAQNIQSSCMDLRDNWCFLWTNETWQNNNWLRDYSDNKIEPTLVYALIYLRMPCTQTMLVEYFIKQLQAITQDSDGIFFWLRRLHRSYVFHHQSWDVFFYKVWYLTLSTSLVARRYSDCIFRQ